MKNKVWLITVIMITIVMSGCSNKESAKNLELKEISNPVEDNIAKPVEIESDAGIFEKIVISKNIQLFEMRDCRDAVIFLLIFIMSWKLYLLINKRKNKKWR